MTIYLSLPILLPISASSIPWENRFLFFYQESQK
jgi:hypothetical protein